MQQDFEKIAADATALANKHTRVDWEAVAANVFLVPLTMGAIALSTTDKDALKKAAMPDEWLQAVASLPDISQKGLELLATDLSRNGYVSVQAASEFVNLEKTAAESRKQADSSAKSKPATGAAMLLARAEKELPGSIARFTLMANDVASAAWGFASFTLEKTILAGKGLGSIASMLKDIRK